MLGLRFCPRLRDFPDRRLIPVNLPGAYPDIASLLGKRIRTEIIREHWDDVIRLVASLKAGHVAPSVMLRKLAAYERQNQIDIALQEIGKIERTLFMLDWLGAPRRLTCHRRQSSQRRSLLQRSNAVGTDPERRGHSRRRALRAGKRWRAPAQGARAGRVGRPASMICRPRLPL